jgi:hypothetical protein
MPDQETIAVPNVVSSTQSAAEAMLKSAGLVVGTVTPVNSTTSPIGTVSRANPAAGTPVSAGSSVNLEVSSGPQQVAVPDVVGLTRPAAEVILKNAGLAVGPVKTQHSNSVPAGGVSSTSPDAGTLVDPASAVELDLSNGPETDWTQYIVPGLFVALGLVVLCVIGYIVTPYGQEFLDKLADKDAARGLITFLIAIATVGIAIILAISTLVLTEGDAGDKRFDRGKQVLSILIGVLGTIVGFYFGSAVPETKNAHSQPLAITTKMLPDGAANTDYQPTTLQATGGTPPLKWSVKPELPAGLTLDKATGTISGKPTTASPKTKFTFTVTDSASPPASTPADLSLEIK